MIKYLLDHQEQFQSRLGTNFKSMTDRERSSYIKEHGYFLIEETTELLREIKFHKSWKDYSDWDAEKTKSQAKLAKQEAIDALCFLTNIFLALDMDENDIINEYNEKNKINHERQQNGY